MGTLARRLAGTTIVLLGSIALITLLLPRLFGWSSMMVTSGSMSPTFDAGAVVVVSPIEPAAIAIGDIIAFRDADGFTTHRVVGITSTSTQGISSLSFTTKGDANEDADPSSLDPRNLVGKAQIAVPRLGYAIDFVRTPLGAGVLAALFLFVVFTGREGNRVAVKESASRPEAVTVP